MQTFTNDERPPSTPRDAQSSRTTHAIPRSLPRFDWFVLVVSILLIPFTQVYVPGMGQRNTLASVTEVLVLLALLLHARIYLRRIPKPILALLLYLGLRVLTGLIMTPDLFSLWWDTSRAILRPLLWSLVVAAAIRPPESARRLLWYYLVTCALAACLHIAGLGGAYQIGSAGELRTSAFNQNANQLGMIYAVGFVIALSLALPSPLEPRRGRARLGLLIVMMLLSTTAVVLTGSRSAMLVVVLGSVLLNPRFGGLHTMVRQLAIGAIACAVLWAAISQNPVVLARFQNLQRNGLESEARALMAPALVGIFARSPLWGTGPEGYRGQLALLSFTAGPLHTGMTAHNNLLMVAVENGLLGLAPFLYAQCWLLVAAWKLRRRFGKLPFAAIVPVLLMGVTTGNFTAYWHYYFLMGLIAGLSNISSARGSSTAVGLAACQGVS